jgi:hypothetical protein
LQIKWTCPEKREVPGAGILAPGDVRTVPNEIGKGLVAAGLAVDNKAEHPAGPAAGDKKKGGK